MLTHKASKRYAKALFELAAEEQALDAVRDDVAALHKLANESQDFSGFLGNYLIPESRRAEVLHALLGGKAHAISLNFLLLLERKKRLALLREICAAFDERYYELKGLLKVTITSAQPLSSQQEEAIRDQLATKYNKTIETSVRIDPSLIGGFRVKIGDLIEDYSLKFQLSELRERILHARA